MWLEPPALLQRKAHDCGNTAARMLFAAHRVGPRGMGVDLSNPVQGMSPDTLEAILWRAFGRLARGSLTLPDLAHFCRTGRPVACLTAHAGGHWVVAWKVARGRVHVRCPDLGANSVPAGDWLDQWHDNANGVEYRQFGICPWPG
jgi:hypothetical protein